MSRVRIALLNAAHGDENTRRNFRRELDADLVEFSATDGHLPDHHDWDGVVVTGSRSSVYWDEAWIQPTKQWVRDAADEGLPCLGVCWGHQLLADALGGRVEDMGEYEIGYRTVQLSGNNPLFDGLDGEYTVFTTHSDSVVELPPGATEIARNDYGNHGFRKGHVFGVQFHPEYDTRTAREVTMGKDELPDERKQAVVDGITERNYAKACEAKRLFENFTSYVRRVDQVGDSATSTAASD
ncbi:type 1 glutamine amidotransferase [Haloarchaeobius sp. HME9146]|uniref:type 1 glutamine amidotransferase n=1 Tax=Haloarchaeobius sp. HME9146 TaxID=2978732 RepID=UPI0021BF26F3|nr:type 1 glutamine amidotransferase [Haloarchaeobius sp. HME9146]MCT9095021.1 type 1 glutamine amidotransferase [Haloarchaeobius sp. HME9146]